MDTQRAIIWDMDGVLVDSHAVHFEAWRQIVRQELGFELDRERFNPMFGWSDAEILAELADGSLSPERVQAISEAKEARYMALTPGRLRPFPGALELVRACDAAGWRQAIATSGPFQNLEIVLRLFNLRPWIRTWACKEDVARGKPDPEVFSVAARRLGIAPARCVVIEDSIAGVEAAHRAGMVCVAVTNTFSAEELAGAERVVSTLEALTPEALAALLEGD